MKDISPGKSNDYSHAVYIRPISGDNIPVNLAADTELAIDIPDGANCFLIQPDSGVTVWVAPGDETFPGIPSSGTAGASSLFELDSGDLMACAKSDGTGKITLYSVEGGLVNLAFFFCGFQYARLGIQPE